MPSRSPLARVGVIGTGHISRTYLAHAADFGLEVVAVADLDPARARAAAEEHGVAVVSAVDELPCRADVDVVLNLTVPAAHAEVTEAAIAADRHVYVEKPLAVRREDGERLVAAAAEAGVRLGVAPDTFLGDGIQTCRRLIDEGAIGEPIGGAVVVAGHGHESWHPSPEFYYQAGGGPVMDMGPYHLTALVSLLGPVRRVSAAARASLAERTIGSGPRAGTRFPVEVPTHVAGTLEFASGAIVNLLMTFDVWAARLPPFQVFGTEGSLDGPDPNTFAGPVQVWRASRGEWEPVPLHRTGRPQTRGLGLAEMMAAVADGRPHRASGELGLHVLDVMSGLVESAELGRHVTVSTSCARPDPI
ncbi:MAG: Gfo/Idh/MocA family oxidoreductase [Chloroflexi bacterium]|nr:MAG: Gfo/Idh/MocA family oxidoreductase [Chloroflexota bacterium]